MIFFLVVQRNSAGVGVIAPISGNNTVIKSMVTHGVRRVNLIKDKAGKVGLRVSFTNINVRQRKYL
jgi:hypothetical protein